MYYSNHSPYPSEQQQQQQQSVRNPGQQQQHHQLSSTGTPVMRGPPPPHQHQHLPKLQQYGGDQAQAAAATWNYYQQNLMRYPVQQPPPTYPPPSYYPNYSSSGYAETQGPPTMPGYYYPSAYPQPPTPYVAYQNQHLCSAPVHQTVPAPVPHYQQNTQPPPNSESRSPGAKIKKEQDEKNPRVEIKDAPSAVAEVKEVKKQPILVGKRRGGRVLPTGVVKKAKTETADQERKDPWSQYMNEVKKYKEQSCSEDQKNRPLVK